MMLMFQYSSFRHTSEVGSISPALLAHRLVARLDKYLLYSRQ